MQIQLEKANSKEEHFSILKAWRKHPNVFRGKYSSGTTPKVQQQHAIIKTNIKSVHLNFDQMTMTIKKKSYQDQKIDIENSQRKQPKTKRKNDFQLENLQTLSKQLDFLDFETPTPKKKVFRYQDYQNSISLRKKLIFEQSRFEADYQVLDRLGQDSFGVVKKCKNKVDGNIYAIKIMNEYEKNLKQVKTLANFSTIQCTNIVRYHNSWIQNSKLYMVMEYCQTSLQKIIDQYRISNLKFSQKQIKEVMGDILRGLSELHRKSIVHLDIKPANILKGINGKFKISDLGMARLAQIEENDDIIEPDLKYSATEILKTFKNEQLPDLTKSDIFSLGITLYQMLTLQKLPNFGKQWEELREFKMKYNLQKNIYCFIYSQKLLKIVQNMIENDFNKRSSADQLLKKPYFNQSKRQNNFREQKQRIFKKHYFSI